MGLDGDLLSAAGIKKVVLFEPDRLSRDASDDDVSTCVGNVSKDSQMKFVALLKGLLHFTKACHETSLYSIEPGARVAGGDHPAVHHLYVEADINPYLNDLFWVIFDKLETFAQMGQYSLASPERGVALTQDEYPSTKDSAAGPGVPSCLKVSGNDFGGGHAVTIRLVHRFPSAWSPTSKASSS